MAIRMGADNHQLKRIVFQNILQPGGKTDVLIVRLRFNLWLTRNIINTLYVVFILAA